MCHQQKGERCKEVKFLYAAEIVISLKYFITTVRFYVIAMVTTKKIPIEDAQKKGIKACHYKKKLTKHKGRHLREKEGKK